MKVQITLTLSIELLARLDEAPGGKSQLVENVIRKHFGMEPYVSKTYRKGRPMLPPDPLEERCIEAFGALDGVFEVRSTEIGDALRAAGVSADRKTVLRALKRLGWKSYRDVAGFETFVQREV